MGNALTICVVVLFAALGFGERKGETQKKRSAPLAEAPRSAHARSNPFEGKPEAVQAGKLLFERYCANCHGAEAQGGKKAPALQSAELEDAPPGDLFWLLTNGSVRAGMPSWVRLPEAQRWQLVSYLKTLREAPRATEPD